MRKFFQLPYSFLVGMGILFSSGGFAQCDSLVNQTDYYKFQGGSYGYNYDHKNACLTLADNSIVTCEPTNTTYPDVHITRMSWKGNKMWEYSYDLGGNDVPQSIINTSDGGYVIAGITEANGGPFHLYRDVFLMKINSSGTVLWSYNYQTAITNYNWGSATVAELSDGKLITVGNTDFQGELSTLYFLKTNSDGTGHVHKRYRMTNRRYQSLEDVVATDNGGFIAVGSSGHNWDYNAVLAIAFNDSFTNPIWSKHYILYTPGGGFPSMVSPSAAGRSNVMAKAIARGEYGDYRIVGFHQNGNQYGGDFTYIKGLVMKIDDNGNQDVLGKELWTFGNDYTLFNDINECVDQPGKWVVAGTVGVNTTAPKNVASYLDLSSGFSKTANLYWGSGTSNRAFNIFNRLVGTQGSPIYDTYVTGYSNQFTDDQPYVLKLESYYPPCVDYEGPTDEETERTWETRSLEMPAPTVDCCYPITLTPQATLDCNAPVELCTDLCDNIKFNVLYLGPNQVKVNATFKSGYLFKDTLVFGDNDTVTTSLHGSVAGEQRSFTHTYTTPGTYTITLYATICDPGGGVVLVKCIIPYVVTVSRSAKIEPEVHTTKEKSFSREVEIAYNPMTNSIYKVEDHPEIPKLLAEQEKLVTNGLDVKIYPNPGTDYTALEINMTKAGNAKVEMYDVNGRLVNVVRDNAKLETGKNIIKADISSLPKGTYFFRIETTEGSTSRSFIKQ